MNQSDIINQYKQISLTDNDVLNLVGRKANFLLYSQLPNFRTLDEVLGPYKACFLLYESKKSYGHWVSIVLLDNGLIEFFDPYGTYIDDELEYIPENFRKISNQNYPHLTALLYQSEYPISYNQYPFQKHGQGINTCGRWSALRIICRWMSLEQFKKNFKKVNGDDLVTLLTMFVNN